MTMPKTPAPYVPNEAYTREDWDDVADNPELTDAEIAELRPCGEGLPPALAAAMKSRGGRPKAQVRKVSVTIRLDQHIVEAFKSTGDGWQTRMNDVLSRAARKIAV